MKKGWESAAAPSQIPTFPKYPNLVKSTFEVICHGVQLSVDYEWMLVPHYTGPKQNTEGYQGAPHAPLAASSPSFPVGKKPVRHQ